MERSTISKLIKDMLPKKCCNCGSTENIQYHHIVPVIYGGNDVPSNIAVLCGYCHSQVHFGRGDIINHDNAIRRGIAKAKANGVKVGRRPADEEKIMRLIAEKSTQFNADSLVTEHEIMELAGVKEVCYAKYKRMLFRAMQAEIWPYEWEKPRQIRLRPMYDRKIKRIRGDAT